MTQPNSVELTRYIRPLRAVGPSRREVDSQQGVTLKIELDYARRLIDVRYAICNHADGEQSFNKTIGNQLAGDRSPITLPMWDGPKKLLGTDLTEYVVTGLNNMAPVGVSRSDLRRINQMFLKSAPRLFNYQ